MDNINELNYYFLIIFFLSLFLYLVLKQHISLLNMLRMEEDRKKRFPLRPEQLSSLFESEKILNKTSLEKYIKLGGKEGILDLLRTTEEEGLDTTNKEALNERIRIYGTNVPPEIETKSLCEIIGEQLEDQILRILILSAVVALILGIWKEGLTTGWIDGVAIIFAVVIIVSVSAVNNYGKEQQFKKLMQLREERNVMIKRNSAIKNKSAHRLLVGDIIFISQGDRIPVDCIMISGFHLLVDESSQTGESNDVEKAPLLSLEDPNVRINPFLLSGSIVKEGKGEAVVCAVGENTRMGRIRRKLEEDSDPSPLQAKLQSIVLAICKVAFVSAILTGLAMFINSIITRANKGEPLLCLDFLHNKKIVTNFNRGYGETNI